jgi:hypothetical protein
MRWFRFHAEALNNPKVQILSPHIFKAWVNILCVASKGDGKIKNDRTLQFYLRETDVGEALGVLCECGLLEDRGTHFVPHDWDDWQYKSDVSTARVKRFRKRFSNVSETPPDTDTDTDTEKKVSKRPKQKIALPLDWRPPDRSRVLASQMGLSIEPIEARFRDYLASNAKHYADYDAAFCNFIRNTPKFNGGQNGVDRSLVKAADRLIERAKAGDFSFGPRPGSAARAVAPNVRLLPPGRSD